MKCTIKYVGHLTRGISFCCYKSSRKVTLLPNHEYVLTDKEVAQAMTSSGKSFYTSLKKIGLVMTIEDQGTPEEIKVDKTTEDAEVNADQEEVEELTTQESEESTPAQLSNEELTAKLVDAMTDEEVDAMLAEVGFSTKKRSKYAKVAELVNSKYEDAIKYLA